MKGRKSWTEKFLTSNLSRKSFCSFRGEGGLMEDDWKLDDSGDIACKLLRRKHHRDCGAGFVDISRSAMAGRSMVVNNSNKENLNHRAKCLVLEKVAMFACHKSVSPQRHRTPVINFISGIGRERTHDEKGKGRNRSQKSDSGVGLENPKGKCLLISKGKVLLDFRISFSRVWRGKWSECLPSIARQWIRKFPSKSDLCIEKSEVNGNATSLE